MPTGLQRDTRDCKQAEQAARDSLGDSRCQHFLSFRRLLSLELLRLALAPSPRFGPGWAAESQALRELDDPVGRQGICLPSSGPSHRLSAVEPARLSSKIVIHKPCGSRTRERNEGQGNSSFV